MVGPPAPQALFAATGAPERYGSEALRAAGFAGEIATDTVRGSVPEIRQDRRNATVYLTEVPGHGIQFLFQLQDSRAKLGSCILLLFKLVQVSFQFGRLLCESNHGLPHYLQGLIIEYRGHWW